MREPVNFLRALALLGVGWSLVGASVSCGDRDVSHSTPPLASAAPDVGLQAAASCVPGQTIECRGFCEQSAVGYQRCAPNGTYLPCVCPLPVSISIDTDERRTLPRSPWAGGLTPGTGGSSGFGASGGPIGSGAGSGVVGARCISNADCISGLDCLTAAGDDLVAGGPAGGYCSMACGSDAACAAVDVASQCIGLAGQLLCVRRCASREPQPNEAKCLGRDDVMCASVAALGQEPPGTGPQSGLCVPACQSDAQCGPGLFCNLGNGLCTSTRPAGAPIGSACVEAEDCASGLCLTLNETFGSFCSGFCTFGVPGCGFDGSEAEAGATCLLTQVRDEGPGDRGLCFASCDTDADCREAGAVCVPAASDGRAGVCLVPAAAPPLPTSTTPVIGNACEQSSDCGAGLSCITATSDFLGIPASPAGGYCTSACGDDGSCPEAGTLCVTRATFSQCLRACNPTVADDCGGRDTLTCQAFATGNPTRGFCAPSCTSDGQCGERVCDPSGLCVEPAEVECEADSDCQAGEVCLTDFGTCLPLPAECLDDEDCAPGECDLETNTCVDGPPECESDEQCAAGVCDTELGLCVAVPPACSSDADCGVQVCDVELGVCVAPPEGCTSDADCAAGGGGAQICDEALGLCVPVPPACLSDAECGGLSCDLELGVCVDVPACAQDADCPGGVCDPSAALCIAAPPVPAGGACLEDGECAGELCASVDGETSFCTAFCLLGSPIGCEPYGSDVFCLLPIAPDDNQVGVCIELCSTAADCAQPGYECFEIGTVINGRSGGCLPPLPAEPPPPEPPPAP